MSVFDTIARGVRDVIELRGRVDRLEGGVRRLDENVAQLARNMVELEKRMIAFENYWRGRADAASETRRLPPS